LRIVTHNVNGIRSACTKGLWQWLMEQRADVICLQEVRADEKVLPDVARAPKGWHAFHHFAARPGYSGVALYSRVKPDKVTVGLGWDDMDPEGRYVQADFGKLSVASLYIPSGSSGETRQAVKYSFLERLETRLRTARRQRREWAVCGDFNIAHKEIDLKNWKANQKNSGFLPDERAFLDRLYSDVGFHDAFRVVNQQAEEYTWWSNRGRAYENNVGWRLDYQAVSPGLAEKVQRASVFKELKFSDHAPLTIDYQHKLTP
jgi:exodeoxyribonuclease-3